MHISEIWWLTIASSSVSNEMSPPCIDTVTSNLESCVHFVTITKHSNLHSINWLQNSYSVYRLNVMCLYHTTPKNFFVSHLALRRQRSRYFWYYCKNEMILVKWSSLFCRKQLRHCLPLRRAHVITTLLMTTRKRMTFKMVTLQETFRHMWVLNSSAMIIINTVVRTTWCNNGNKTFFAINALLTNILPHNDVGRIRDILKNYR